MPTSPESPLPASTSGLTRRGVVRTAAWSVPVVSLVTAAPAFAASGEEIGRVGVPVAAMNYFEEETLSTPYGDQLGFIQGEAQILNLSPTATLTGLSLTLVFAGEWLEGEFLDIQSALPGGWSAQGWPSPSRSDTPGAGAEGRGPHLAGGTTLFTFDMPPLAPEEQKALVFDVAIPADLARRIYQVIGLTLTSPPGWSLADDTTATLNWPSVS